MKFGYYDNSENKDLIQNYEKQDNKIVITFLDGSNYEISLSKENEANLLNLMIEQAQDRSESDELYLVQQRRKKILMSSVVYTVLNLININYANKTDSNFLRTFTSILCCITGLCIVTDIFFCKFSNDEIKELKKYDIYLSIRKTLEKNITDPNLFKGVKSQQLELNINTLDDYSLSDIKKIQSNLRKIEKYSQYFTDSSDTLKLENKIDK